MRSVMNRPETRQKTSDAGKRRFADPEQRLATSIATKAAMQRQDVKEKHAKGIANRPPRTEEHERNRLAGLRSPEGRANSSKGHKGKVLPTRGIKRSDEVREKMSASQIRAIQEGRSRAGMQGKNGWFHSEKNGKDLKYRSLLELAWYELLERLDVVVSYEVEPCVIPYEFTGILHRYLPDLLVRYRDGSKQLVEIKPEFQWDYPQNKAKWVAAQDWCARQSEPIEFKVVGYKGIAA